MKNVYKFCFLVEIQLFFFVYIRIYFCIFALLALLGNQFFPMIYPESQPPTGPVRFREGQGGRIVNKTSRWKSQISFGKRDVFPFFVQFKMLGTFKRKIETDVFLDDFLRMRFFFKHFVVYICFVWLEFCVLSRCWSWQSAQLWENEGLIEGY